MSANVDGCGLIWTVSHLERQRNECIAIIQHYQCNWKALYYAMGLGWGYRVGRLKALPEGATGRFLAASSGYWQVFNVTSKVY